MRFIHTSEILYGYIQKRNILKIIFNALDTSIFNKK